MSETPKRLPPTRETLRELYLKSGNRCSFPGCKKALFNSKGKFVAQICHIEAAMPKGERFNKKQSNEDRRKPSNLILMCYEHHIETNDVEEYPVDRMFRIKKEHEKMFLDVVGSMLLTVTDHTTLSEPNYSKNLRRLDRIMKWKCTEEELSECVSEVNNLAKKLSKIPVPTRELFLVIVNRSRMGSYGAELDVSIPDVQQSTSLSTQELRDCFSILESSCFTYDNDKDDFGVQLVGISALESGWPIWSDIKMFCEKTKTDVAQIILNLDFSMFDENR